MNYSASTADVDKWEDHFTDMAEGRIFPNKYGVFIVKSKPSREDDSSEEKAEEESEKNIPLQLVTPSAQVLEIAKSDIKNAPPDGELDPVTHFEENRTDNKRKQEKAKRKIKEVTSTRNKNSKKKKIEYWTRF